MHIFISRNILISGNIANCAEHVNLYLIFFIPNGYLKENCKLAISIFTLNLVKTAANYVKVSHKHYYSNISVLFRIQSSKKVIEKSQFLSLPNQYVITTLVEDEDCK